MTTDWHNLVTSNLDLAPKCVRLYCKGRNCVYDTEDLISEAALVLCKVAQARQYESVTHFRSVAAASIRNRLIDLKRGGQYLNYAHPDDGLVEVKLKAVQTRGYDLNSQREAQTRRRWWEVEGELDEDELDTVTLVARGLTNQEVGRVRGEGRIKVGKRLTEIRNRLGVVK